MSKDIKIEKVGVPQELDGVSKIVTSSPDFFQATWIPEEETSLIGKLKIHRNGHYDADNFMVPVVSDGVETEKQIYGFSEITVDVPIKPPIITGDIDIDIPPIDIDIPPIDIDIPPIDIDIPPIDIVIPPIDIEIPEFPPDIIGITHIDDNGNIIAITRQDLEDMDLTIEDIDGMSDPVLTIDDFGNIDIVDAFDTDLSGLEVIDLAIGDIDLKVDGLDDDGRTKFIDEYLPTSIELTVPPNKLVYHDGEPIDLTGAIVSAKYRGGTAVWANEKYPNGIVPLGELIINPPIASASSMKISKKSDLFPRELSQQISQPISTGGSSATLKRYDTWETSAMLYLAYKECRVKITYTYSSGDPVVSAAFVRPRTITEDDSLISGERGDYNRSYFIIFASKKPNAILIKKEETHVNRHYDYSEISTRESTQKLNKMATFFGKTAYYAVVEVISSLSYINVYSGDNPYTPFVDYYYDPGMTFSGAINSVANNALSEGYDKAAWIMLYGDGNAEVRLDWPRPKDGKILTTSFKIMVEDEESINNENS